MAPAVSVPQHKLFESPTSRSIHVGDWQITSTTTPISSAGQCDELQATLGFTLPEMIFGNNSLKLEHRPSGWVLEFTAEGALKCVRNGEAQPGDGAVKVEYADKWLSSRTGPSPSLPMPKTAPTKLFDWTYTTTYTGHSSGGSSADSQWSKSDPNESSQSIPFVELTRPDPILFYAEVPLFEDELHDNGSSDLIVRIRVMPTCIFLLARFTLRVDNVLFRTHDTRIFHSFASSPARIVREVSGWEGPYEFVKRVETIFLSALHMPDSIQHLKKKDDLSPLTDPAFIAKILSETPSELSQGEGAKTGWRGLGSRVEYLDLPEQGEGTS